MATRTSTIIHNNSFTLYYRYHIIRYHVEISVSSGQLGIVADSSLQSAVAGPYQPSGSSKSWSGALLSVTFPFLVSKERSYMRPGLPIFEIQLVKRR